MCTHHKKIPYIVPSINITILNTLPKLSLNNNNGSHRKVAISSIFDHEQRNTIKCWHKSTTVLSTQYYVAIVYMVRNAYPYKILLPIRPPLVAPRHFFFGAKFGGKNMKNPLFILAQKSREIGGENCFLKVNRVTFLLVLTVPKPVGLHTAGRVRKGTRRRILRRLLGGL